jgi:hypothetical protein
VPPPPRRIFGAGVVARGVNREGEEKEEARQQPRRAVVVIVIVVIIASEKNKQKSQNRAPRALFCRGKTRREKRMCHLFFLFVFVCFSGVLVSFAICSCVLVFLFFCAREGGK